MNKAKYCFIGLGLATMTGCVNTPKAYPLMKHDVGHGVMRYENGELRCYEFVSLNGAVVHCQFKKPGVGQDAVTKFKYARRIIQ